MGTGRRERFNQGELIGLGKRWKSSLMDETEGWGNMETDASGRAAVVSDSVEAECLEAKQQF